MPTFLEMMDAYNPVTSSLLDSGADPAMFDLGTQDSINSTMREHARAVADRFVSYVQNPTTFFDDIEKASDSANSLLTNASMPSSGGSRRTSALSYQNADLAAAFGMNSATAYQEALANTAHQREVADLKAAGLNPVLSATQGRGAGTVTSAEAAAAPGGASNSASGFASALQNVKEVLNLVKLAKSVF